MFGLMATVVILPVTTIESIWGEIAICDFLLGIATTIGVTCLIMAMYFQIEANKITEVEEQINKKKLLTYVLRVLIVNIFGSSLPIIIANIIYLSNMGNTALEDDLSALWILEQVIAFATAIWEIIDRRNTILGLRSQIKDAFGPVSPIFVGLFFNALVNIVEEVVINVAVTVNIITTEELKIREQWRQIVIEQGLRPWSNNMYDLVAQLSLLLRANTSDVLRLGTSDILSVLSNHYEKKARGIERRLPNKQTFAYSEIFGNPSLGSWFSDKDYTMNNGEITSIAFMESKEPGNIHWVGFGYGPNGIYCGPRKGQPQMIMLEPDEIITVVHGEAHNHVGKLMFHTNRDRHLGPYSQGRGDGKPFSFSIPGYKLAFINGTWSCNSYFFLAIQFVWVKTVNEAVQGEAWEISFPMSIENSSESPSIYALQEYEWTGPQGEP